MCRVYVPIIPWLCRNGIALYVAFKCKDIYKCNRQLRLKYALYTTIVIYHRIMHKCNKMYESVALSCTIIVQYECFQIMYIMITIGKTPIMCVFAYVPECSGCNVVIVMYKTIYTSSFIYMNYCKNWRKYS